MVTVDLIRIQRRRKYLLASLIGLLVIATACISDAWWPASKGMHKAIEWTGIALILVCIAGRTWCTLYIGARKKRELVTIGPYSVCRNPLYAFTIVGAFGAGAQYGSLVIASAAAFATYAIFLAVVRHEEAFLADNFGPEFARYVASVPRLVPNFSRWNDVPELNVSPQLIVRTVLDASLFLLAIPASEIVELLQRQGVLLVLFRLP